MGDQSDPRVYEGLSRRQVLRTGGALGLLAGLQACSGPRSSSDDAKRSGSRSGPLTYTRQSQINKGEKITLTVWNYKAAFEPIFAKYFKQYTDMYPNVQFQQTTLPYADMLTKLRTAIPARQGPDLFYIHWLWHPPLVETKLVKPLPEDRFPLGVLRDSFENMDAVLGSDGKAYWLPLGFLSGGLHINQAMWSAKGLKDSDVPKTWDQVVEIGKELTVRDTAGRIQVAGYNPTGYIQSTWRYLYYQQGYWSMNKDYSKHYFNTDEVRRTLKFFDDVYKVHKLSTPDFLKFDESFGSGKAAMIFMWTNTLPNIRKYPQLSFKTYPAPTWTGKLSPSVGHGTLDPQSLVVPSTVDDARAEVGFDLINFLYSNKDFLVDTALDQASPPLARSIQDDPRIKNDPIISTLLPQTPYIVQTMGMPQEVSDAATKYTFEAPFTAGMPIDQALREGQTALDAIFRRSGPFPNIREHQYKYADQMRFR